jgi:hypothetical protein
VLQMPIAEACHIALQRQPVGKQKVWKHVQVRSLMSVGKSMRGWGRTQPCTGRWQLSPGARAWTWSHTKRPAGLSTRYCLKGAAIQHVMHYQQGLSHRFERCQID